MRRRLWTRRTGGTPGGRRSSGGKRTPVEEVEEEEFELEEENEESAVDLPVFAGEACTEPGPYPAPYWETSTPEAEGMDSDLLEEAAQFAGESDSSCMVVIRNGKLVGEWYWGFTDETTLIKSWSVTKSYSATLAGVALSRGDLGSVDDRVADYVPEWDVEPYSWVTPAPFDVHDLGPEIRIDCRQHRDHPRERYVQKGIGMADDPYPGSALGIQ